MRCSSLSQALILTQKLSNRNKRKLLSSSNYIFLWFMAINIFILLKIMLSHTLNTYLHIYCSGINRSWNPNHFTQCQEHARHHEHDFRRYSGTQLPLVSKLVKYLNWLIIQKWDHVFPLFWEFVLHFWHYINKNGNGYS